MRRFEGVYAVILTPFKQNEDVDEKALASHLEFLIKEGGVHGIIGLGSTAEVFSLRDDERQRVMEMVLAIVDKRVPVLMGASANATRDCIRYAEAAEKAGADGLMLVHPIYCLPQPEELYAHYVDVDKSVSIPIMIYNNPFTTGVDMKPELFARVVENTRNIRYIKESSGDEARVGQILELLRDTVTVFNGWDNIILEQFLVGARGWVAGSANVIPRQCVQLYQLAVEEQDFVRARKLYRELYAFLTMVEASGKFIQYCKWGLQELGRSVGPCRRPLRIPTDPTEIGALTKALKRADAADLVSTRA
jgi:4-hydroxy-tetrahydrodipicolinate synthase